MQKMLVCFLTAATLSATTAWGEVDAGRTYEEGRTERRGTEVMEGVYDSPLNISARVGGMGFADGLQNYTGRMVEGITLAFNAVPLLSDIKDPNLGLEVGLLYSHVGSPGSNFIGTNSPVPVAGGANAFLFPINLVAGARLSDRIVLNGLVGATGIYRNISNTMAFGRAADATAGSSTEFFPSLGVNLGWEVSQNVAVALRGDYIVTPGADMFTTSVGATFPLA